MKNIFDADGGFMRGLGKVADIVLLNIVFVLSCLPIFTIGAATTGMYYVALKLARREDGYIIKGFFKAFKENFKKATIIWLGQLLILLILAADVFILSRLEGTYVSALFVVIMIPLFMVIFTAAYVYPLLARFENSIKNTVKNAFLLSIANLPKTLVMLTSTVFLAVVSCWNMTFLPLLVLCAFSLPAYSNSLVLNGIFLKLEPKAQPVQTEDEGIFKESDLIEQAGR